MVQSRRGGGTGRGAEIGGHPAQSSGTCREQWIMKRGRTNFLLRAYRSLMPRGEDFVERFCEHSRLIVPAAEAFRALMSDDGQAEKHATEISRLEDAADQVTRRTVLAIHRTFVTPFDRSQILDLITALD